MAKTSGAAATPAKTAAAKPAAKSTAAPAAKTDVKKIKVTVAQVPGGKAQEVEIAAGSTVADALARADIPSASKNREISIAGKVVGKDRKLKGGEVITLAKKAKGN